MSDHSDSNLQIHDSRCQGGIEADRKLLADVAHYGWHVMKVLDTPETPAWGIPSASSEITDIQKSSCLASI